MLQVSDLGFSYGNREILKGISFDAEKGNIISILGPNGVGKTTLLKCICGMLDPSGGSVSVNGTDISSLKPRELARYIAYVPQSASVSRTTVFDSVLVGRRPHIEWSATKKDIDLTWSTMTNMGLKGLALKYIDSVSGGELQKVQIARAMVQEPDMLILDEPTSSLDISNAHMMMHMVFDAVKKRNLCTIMTMHDINLAVHFSDLFMFMSNGEVKAYGGKEIITRELIEEVYGISVDVIDHGGTPFIIPLWNQSGSVHKGHSARGHIDDGHLRELTGV